MNRTGKIGAGDKGAFVLSPVLGGGFDFKHSNFSSLVLLQLSGDVHNSTVAPLLFI